MNLLPTLLCFAVLVSTAAARTKLTKEEEKKIVSEAEKEAGTAIAKLLQEKIGSKVLEAAREVKGILSKHLGKHIKTTASNILRKARKKSKKFSGAKGVGRHDDDVSEFSSEETCSEKCRAKKLAGKVKGVQPLLKKLKKIHKGASISQTVHNTGSRLRKNDAKATHAKASSESEEGKAESTEHNPQDALPSSGHQQTVTSSEAGNTEGWQVEALNGEECDYRPCQGTSIELVNSSPMNEDHQGVQGMEHVAGPQITPGPHRLYQCPSPCPSICAPTCSQDCCRPMLSLSQFPPPAPYYPSAPQGMAPPAPPPPTYYAPPAPAPAPAPEYYVPVAVTTPEMAAPPPPPPPPPPAPSHCPPTCYLHCYSICPDGCCGVTKRRVITNKAKKHSSISKEKKHM